MSDVPPSSGEGVPGAGGPPSYPATPPSYPGDPAPPPAARPYPGAPASYPPVGSYPPPGGYGEPGSSSSYASFGARLGGWLIDWVIVSIVGFVVDRVFNALSVARITFHTTTGHGSATVTHVSHFSFLAAVVNLIIVLLYGAFLCGSARGQTIGMMAVGAKAVDAQTGAPIGFSRALGRAAFEVLLFIVFFIPWVVDMLFPAWDPRRQTLHDKVTRTVVVKTSGVPSA